VSVRPAAEALAVVELGSLGFDRGGHLLVERALGRVGVGEALEVRGRDPHLGLHLRAWCRGRGHELIRSDVVMRKAVADGRWAGAQRAGGPGTDGLVAHPPASWGVAARGALLEQGAPPLSGCDLDRRDEVWTDLAPKLYAQALAGQWDPATAVDWSQGDPLAPEVEAAVVQLMTYLVENEQTALVVPARFLGRIHPHFREVMQFLAVQVADEARHMEVFTRRALLNGSEMATSGAGGRASLQTLVTEPEYSVASFLLSVLGEGTFLHLLSFLERYAPDGVTRQICRLALGDEARHVAFGQAHLEHRMSVDPTLRDRLRAAVHRRHDALAATSGLSSDVFDALVVLAAGDWAPDAIGRGWDRVMSLQGEMDEGRQRRLVRLGFESGEAQELSQLHTRNFM